MSFISGYPGQRKTYGEQQVTLNNAIAFNGEGLNIDYAGHLSQQDIVYQALPREFRESMPLGDGDIGASVWCPGHLQMQVNKVDLWADPPLIGEKKLAGPAGNWQRISAGTISIHTDPEIIADPQTFEQRLNLHSGLITLKADTIQGSCQITTFASATAGVIVINYQDQTLRSTPRWVELTHQREGHHFALGETIGILHPLRDRRCAMVARIVGHPGQAAIKNKNTTSLVLEPRRSSNFTVYIAVAVSAKEQDPVRSAKSRLENAIGVGYEKLLQEHRKHWSEFWQKSFLKISGPRNDVMAGYLENLWHLNLYHMAACSRGFDAPLPEGGLWEEEVVRKPPASLYVGADLRAMIAPMLPANHLELTVPFLETYHRMIPTLEERTTLDIGAAGVRFPSRFNHHGDEFIDSGAANGSSEITKKGDIGDGIGASLLFWEAWRFASDPVLLRERIYPMLRMVLEYTLSFARMEPANFVKSVSYSKLAALIHAALFASVELETDQEHRELWSRALNHWHNELELGDPQSGNTLLQLTTDNLDHEIVEWLRSEKQMPQGFFYGESNRPNLVRSGDICIAISAMMMREEELKSEDDPVFPIKQGELSLSENTAMKFFPVLPKEWDVAFNLLAPGGFKITGEAHGGDPRYIAIKSMHGRPIRFFNPWGAGCMLRISEGKKLIAKSESNVIQIETIKDCTYVLEKVSYPLSSSLRSRYSGKRNENPRILRDDIILGIKKVVIQE